MPRTTQSNYGLQPRKQKVGEEKKKLPQVIVKDGVVYTKPRDIANTNNAELITKSKRLIRNIPPPQ